MQIGPHTLSNNLVLAPMAGVSDRAFRQLCRRHGAALAVSEMVTADPSLWGSRKSSQRMDHRGESGPLSVQILGADPAMMAEAARMSAARGADIVDINMGCPAKKVCQAAAGSALLRDERLVGSILDAVVAAAGVPVTLKIRTGWDREHRNAVRIARLAENAGIQALAVHGRTRAEGFAGTAEYDTIRDVKQAVGIPVIANGDIGDPLKAAQVLRHTGADAVMIGRAARGRPWIFADIYEWLTYGKSPEPKPDSWVCDLMLEHLDALYRFYGREQGVRVARKHIAWYTSGRADSGAFRAWCFAADTPAEQQRRVREYFAGPADKYTEEQAA